MFRKSIVYLVSLLLLVLSKADSLYFQDGTDEIIKKSAEALQKGNAEELTRFFYRIVEIELLGEENFYSQVQALQLLKNFFKRNIPVRFTIDHKGAKELTAFAIGTLQCKNGVFRVSLFLKTDESKTFIHQLRIESESQFNPK